MLTPTHVLVHTTRLLGRHTSHQTPGGPVEDSTMKPNDRRHVANITAVLQHAAFHSTPAAGMCIPDDGKSYPYPHHKMMQQRKNGRGATVHRTRTPPVRYIPSLWAAPGASLALWGNRVNVCAAHTTKKPHRPAAVPPSSSQTRQAHARTPLTVAHTTVRLMHTHARTPAISSCEQSNADLPCMP